MPKPFSPLKSALSRTFSCLALATLGMAAAPVFAGPVYTEVGDSGQTLATAQTPSGGGALTDIFGSFFGATDADLYLINITNPATFSASTVNATGGLLDTHLFLFTLAGAPVYINDDASGLDVLSTLPAGSALRPASAGLYFLGVANAGYDPVNGASQLLFATGLPTDVRGPASGLSPATLGGFADNTFFGSDGPYRIQLTGASSIPEPTSALLAAMAGGLCAFTTSKRRRRIASTTAA